jgi:midasin
MVHFNESLSHAVVSDRTFGRDGAPWEFNLRDVLRWCELTEAAAEASSTSAADDAFYAAAAATFPVVYLRRMRTTADRDLAAALFCKHFGLDSYVDAPPVVVPGSDVTRVGVAILPRGNAASRNVVPALLLRQQLPCMEAAAAALARGWMAILVGPSASGKTVLARSLALLAGARLHEVRALPAASSGCQALEVTKERNTLLCPTQVLDTLLRMKLLHFDLIQPSDHLVCTASHA